MFAARETGYRANMSHRGPGTLPPKRVVLFNSIERVREVRSTRREALVGGMERIMTRDKFLILSRWDLTRGWVEPWISLERKISD